MPNSTLKSIQQQQLAINLNRLVNLSSSLPPSLPFSPSYSQLPSLFPSLPFNLPFNLVGNNLATGAPASGPSHAVATGAQPAPSSAAGATANTAATPITAPAINKNIAHLHRPKNSSPLAQQVVTNNASYVAAAAAAAAARARAGAGAGAGATPTQTATPGSASASAPGQTPSATSGHAPASGSAQAAANTHNPAPAPAVAPAAAPAAVAAPASASAHVQHLDDAANERRRREIQSRRLFLAEMRKDKQWNEFERSAIQDMDDLWDETLKVARSKRAGLEDGEIDELLQMRQAYGQQREANIHAAKWQAHRYFLAEGIDQPEYQQGHEPQGVDPNAASRGDNYHTIELPSAGPAFEPPRKPRPEFLAELRQDMLTPMRRPTMAPRGLRNPSNLCYRNAVVTALLNTPRFLSFLYVHGRNIRTYMQCPDVNHHLLTRLYHLAVAYWERDGVHPMSDAMGADNGPDLNPGPSARSRLYPPTAGDKRRRDGSAASGSDSYEKMLTLFWRACKYDLTGTPWASTLNVADGERRRPDGTGPPGQHDDNFATLSWHDLCQQQADQFAANFLNMPSVGAVDLTSQQQDAAEFLGWLVEMAATQLYSAPRRYSASRASEYYDCMFRTYITDRFLCTMCKRPVRLRGERIERAPSIVLPVAEAGRSTAAAAAAAPGNGGGPRRLEGRDGLMKLLHKFFNEDVEGQTCNRCGQTPRTLRRMRRMQTAPEVLNIHLARTGYDRTQQRTFKTSDIVDAPEFLDVSRYLETHIFAPGTRILYRLAAVVSHAGDSAQSGHYVSYVRDDRLAALTSTVSRPAGAPVYDADEVERLVRESAERKKNIANASHQLSETIRVENQGRRGVLLTPAEAARRREQNSMRYMAIESTDSGWARINDDRLVPGVPFTRIVNTSRDPAYHPNNGSGDWFDPVLLVYEKWVETFVVDKPTGERTYQLPLNVPGQYALFMGRTRGNAPDPHPRPVNREVDERLWRQNANKDVRIPDHGPPRRVARLPRGIFSDEDGDDILYVDRDADASGNDGRGDSASRPITINDGDSHGNGRAAAAPSASGAGQTGTGDSSSSAAAAATGGGSTSSATPTGGGGNGVASVAAPVPGNASGSTAAALTAPAGATGATGAPSTAPVAPGALSTAPVAPAAGNGGGSGGGDGGGGNGGGGNGGGGNGGGGNGGGDGGGGGNVPLAGGSVRVFSSSGRKAARGPPPAKRRRLGDMFWGFFGQ
ncbi:hypothetical protein HMPREF1624_03865 [Sporothrix schenckii ATCC 58251]|uniref:ubiquitinyl hydrolase 1 n=1 Tax=Sporothrix schenckii (strain ATCC 58251 / de Perez 2211183) TaxID=1391915 RepID=U7Q005_SPOS1|nr:hypothetical protein HMPREF1624_03865 [Sporothrix schenckii ATCC 58251]